MDIILLEPETAGNVGAVARVMANFGFLNLVLVNPQCDFLCEDALGRAKHAKFVLKNAKVINFDGLKKYHTLVGTTSQLGTDYNIPRSPLSPQQLAEILPLNKKNIGLLFGRESIGLKNDEIELCDFVATIETSKRYPTLNLSHAVAVLCYELFRKNAVEFISSHIRFASDVDKAQLMKMITVQIDGMKFSTIEKKETQQKIWKRIVAKSFLTKREAFAMMGFFRKL